MRNVLPRPEKPLAVCERCGRSFPPRRGNPNRFCSRPCFYEARSKRVSAICTTCNRSFDFLPGQTKGLYCSLECLRLYQNPSAACAVCGEVFQHRPNRKPKYCSPACYNRKRAAAKLIRPPCRVPGCSELAKVKKRQLCWAHYQYDRRHGQPEPEPIRPLALEPTDAAWIAGILDGEGYLGIVGTTASYGPRIAVLNTNHPMIDHLCALTGVGTVGFRKARGNKRPAWVWKLDRREHVAALLLAALPYLITKREQALILLELPTRQMKRPEERKRLFERIRSLNRRGNPDPRC